VTDGELEELIDLASIVHICHPPVASPYCERQEWDEYLEECSEPERETLETKEMEDPDYRAEVERCRARTDIYTFDPQPIPAAVLRRWRRVYGIDC